MASESGCPIEHHRIPVDKCDHMYDPDCQGTKSMPFLRAAYDRNTGQSPNSPREQVRYNRFPLFLISWLNSYSGKYSRLILLFCSNIPLQEHDGNKKQVNTDLNDQISKAKYSCNRLFSLRFLICITTSITKSHPYRNVNYIQRATIRLPKVRF